MSRFSFGMINFAVPLYALKLGMDLSEIGLLVSLRLGIGLALTPAAGWAADILGRKRLLLGGLAVRALVPLLFMFAAVPWHLVSIRMLHGASTAARDPAASSLLADHADEGRLASAFAWQATARHVGGTLGAAFAGILIGLSGANYDIVFGAAFALSVLPFILTAALVAELKDDGSLTLGKEAPAIEEQPPEPVPPKAPRPTKPHPPLAALAFMGMAISGASHMIHGLFPVLATEYAGLSAAQAGIIYTASGLVVLAGGPAFGWLADRLGSGPVLLVRSLSNTASSLLYLGAPSFAGMTAGHLTDDLGKAAFRPAWGATMAEAAAQDRRHRTRRLAFVDTGREAGETFAPLLGGLIWDIWGVTALLLIRIGVAAAAEVYTLALSLASHFGDVKRSWLRVVGATVDGAQLPRCAFCSRISSSFEAVSSLDVMRGMWRRQILPACSRCRHALQDAGEEGIVLKATNEQWWLGHTAGSSADTQPAIAPATEFSPSRGQYFAGPSMNGSAKQEQHRRRGATSTPSDERPRKTAQARQKVTPRRL